ncbi:MAG: alpha/beta hydrolase [Actinobacteria bacterium]|nr:MAG: alpha/beta hydrolase [Actinomycetota bacterium]
MRHDVEFRTEDGTLLRGYLHAGEDPAPGIVMCHGFSGVKEQIDHYAAVFATAGYSVLVYDHRGFGDSDGTPRLEVDPYRQIADWRDAISFAASRPEFDPTGGFGIWGSSFAGGLAIVIAACEPRVSCVVAQIPHVRGPRNSRQMFSTQEREQLLPLIAKDREARLAGAAPATIPVFTSDRTALCALPPAMPADFIAETERNYPTWRNEVTLRSVAHLMEWDSAGWLVNLAPKPLLMIVGARDQCTFAEIQCEAFELAAGPKRLVVHPGGHFDTYTDHFVQTSREAREWYRAHLPVSTGSAREPAAAV